MTGHRNDVIARHPSTIRKRQRTRGEAPAAPAELDLLTPTAQDPTAWPSDTFLHKNWRGVLHPDAVKDTEFWTSLGNKLRVSLGETVTIWGSTFLAGVR